MHFSRQLNCWKIRCSWSIACRRCSNYIFIFHLTLGFNILRKDNCKPRWEISKFWNSVWLILEILRYFQSIQFSVLHYHDDVMTGKRFQHYWPFVRGIQQSLVVSPHKGPVMWNFYWLFVRGIQQSLVISPHKGPVMWNFYWPFVRGIYQSLVDSPHKGPVMWSFNVFFDVHLSKQLNKQWRCRWSETLWHWHDVAMIICIYVFASRLTRGTRIVVPVMATRGDMPYCTGWK